ncbi:agamous-like MADS-box protein AGL81 isoform X2 [Vigna angularis]|uniref:agamous-like MADS-box protein AGL81 isoform X2 n=1 Tax=Phaseolus angularis TaxID=3914 RepID=UPI0022B49B7A|nr:agamous-like MADS-box protein AGL81 isoform X2 [Vigna angularis]
MARRKKVTLKLIENFVARKARYRKIRENLLKKVEDLTTLCDVNACAIIYGPGDDVPTVWPSHDIAKELLDKFENAPLPERLKKNVTPQLYIDQMNRKIEKQVMKLKKKNDEKDMSNFLHNIHDDEQVFQQQSFLDSTKETGPMNSDSDNNKNTGLPPLQQHAHDNTGLSQVNFESLNLDDIGMVLHSANFNDVIDDNGLAFGMLAQDNYIGICDNGDLGLLHGSSSGGEITGNDIWSSYESFGDISESDTMLPFNNNVQDNIDGTFMGANVENEGVSINNIELSGDQRTTSGGHLNS